MSESISVSSALRKSYINDISSLTTNTPEMHSDAKELFEKISELERQYVAPTLRQADYLHGTAERADEIKTINFGQAVLLSADHATNPVRFSTGEIGNADHGTAGLGAALADEKTGTVVIPVGRQTGNANVNQKHPLKHAVAELLPAHSSFLSVHGMKPGKFYDPHDVTEIHGVLGLGRDPSEKMLDMASDFKRQIKADFGLQIAVGNTETFFDDPYQNGTINYDEDGNPIHSHRLAAFGPGTTTNFVRSKTTDDFPALQIEISRSLRLLPKELEYRDVLAKALGVYMGHCITSQLVDFVQSAATS